MKYRYIIYSFFISWIVVVSTYYGWGIYEAKLTNGTLFGCRDYIPNNTCFQLLVVEYFKMLSDILFSSIIFVFSAYFIPCILLGIGLVFYYKKGGNKNPLLLTALGIAYFVSIYLTALDSRILWWIPFLQIQSYLHIIFLIGLIPFWKFKIDVKIGKFFVGLFRRISFKNPIVT